MEGRFRAIQLLAALFACAILSPAQPTSSPKTSPTEADSAAAFHCCNNSVRGWVRSDRGGRVLVSSPKIGELMTAKWLFTLIRQKRSWAPDVVLGEVWRLLVNIDKHSKVFAILKARPFAEITQDDPGFAFKYVTPNYLARGFTLTERVSCFLHHYRRLHSTFSESALREILLEGLTIHQTSHEVNSFAITIGSPDENSRLEGELSLNLLVNGKTIFGLSFTIVPGWVVRSEVAEIILVTRLQGTPGCNAEIKLACRAYYYYPPRGVLLAALEGIADALAIGYIEAVCAKMQKTYTENRDDIFVNGYDDFFEKAGLGKTPAGFYSSPIPIRGRPLESFKGSARWRAKKRRIMIQQIQSACSRCLEEKGEA
jgi:uncharacterized protein